MRDDLKKLRADLKTDKTAKNLFLECLMLKNGKVKNSERLEKIELDRAENNAEHKQRVKFYGWLEELYEAEEDCEIERQSRCSGLEGEIYVLAGRIWDVENSDQTSEVMTTLDDITAKQVLDKLEQHKKLAAESIEFSPFLHLWNKDGTDRNVV